MRLIHAGTKSCRWRYIRKGNRTVVLHLLTIGRASVSPENFTRINDSIIPQQLVSARLLYQLAALLIPTTHTFGTKQEVNKSAKTDKPAHSNMTTLSPRSTLNSKLKAARFSFDSFDTKTRVLVSH
mmetsp:Transcript_41825/g.100813  ORF Transcript_41825/g.100813 Transcript_41825/m.100813 type:complete len:126 (+) Transcript_41825:4466-4843(+)